MMSKIVIEAEGLSVISLFDGLLRTPFDGLIVG
jgi:hypothetical protein